MPLLVGRNPLLVLDLGLHILYRVGWFHLQGDGLAGQSLNEDLHTTPEPEDEVEGRFLLDVVVGQSPAVFQLLPSEDKPLLVWRNPLLVLDLCLDVLDRVRRLHLQGDRLASQSLHKDLHTPSESEDEVEGGLLLDVVIGEGSSVFELLPSENQPLLVWRDPFLVLDLSLDVLDGVRGLDLQSDGLPSKGLDEDLHGPRIKLDKSSLNEVNQADIS